MAVSLSAFLLLLSLLSSRVAAAAVGRRGNQGFVAFSVANDNNGIE
jgi:hypothetical protein